jgi:hypothetical protein
MAKSKIQKGFYPISITDVKRYIRNCRGWDYGNKDTCKYVAECVIDKLSLEHEDLPLKEGLYHELVGIAHDLNSGSLMKKIEIKLVD